MLYRPGRLLPCRAPGVDHLLVLRFFLYVIACRIQFTISFRSGFRLRLYNLGGPSWSVAATRIT